MDSNLRREIIINELENPTNKGLVDDNEYIKVNTNNISCIDNIYLMAKIKERKIIDLRFDGEACSITTSATGLMIKGMLGKNIEEVKEIIRNYENMLYEREYDQDLLNDLIVYNEISKQPNRLKCAMLPIESLKKILDIYEEKN